jgi:hypothetical protein
VATPVIDLPVHLASTRPNLDPYGQLLRMLMPRALGIGFYDSAGVPLWIADGYDGPDPSPLVQEALTNAPPATTARIDDLQGKFVDRSGRLYAKPEIVNTIGGDAPTIEIGTDVAAAFTGVAMEALTDAAFGTPVLKKGDQYFTESNRIPTFAALFGVVEAIQEDGTRRGVTELELSLIRYVSDLAGTKSRILSDLVFGLLREGEVQLVVGAHFSFGDHDTLRVLLDTLFDVASRKITSHLAYKGLSEFTYEEVNGRIHASGASDTPLGRVIALLLQEQALLAELLPAGAE